MTPLPLWIKRRCAKSENLPTQKVILCTSQQRGTDFFLNFKRPGTEFSIYDSPIYCKYNGRPNITDAVMFNLSQLAWSKIGTTLLKKTSRIMTGRFSGSCRAICPACVCLYVRTIFLQ